MKPNPNHTAATEDLFKTLGDAFRPKQFKLSIECPADFDPKLWPYINGRLIELLESDYNLITDCDDFCNIRFHELYNDSEISELTHLIFGPTTDNYYFNLIANLRFIANGSCPSCGCNRNNPATEQDLQDYVICSACKNVFEK
jgi:hypothetical protein